jgi:hypothetical protein
VIRVVLEVPPATPASGLSVYGSGSGRFPIDPTVILEVQNAIAAN